MPQKNIPTICGLLAIIFWSSSVAIIKSLSPKVGSVFPTAFVYTSGGLTLLCWDYFSENKFSFLSFPRKYLLTCGSLFLICMLTFYLAVGLANSSEAVIGVGLVNYTWPSLTLIFSIPILNRRAKPMLILGILLASFGVFLAVNSETSLKGFLTSIKVDLLAYILAIIASATWALHSNYSVKLAGETKGNAISIFMLATGLIVLPYYLYFEKIPEIDLRSAIELIVLAATNTLAYLFWDLGIRKGNIILVSSFAYLTPLLSTLWTCLYLGLPISSKIISACLLIIAGAIVCSKSLESKTNINAS